MNDVPQQVDLNIHIKFDPPEFDTGNHPKTERHSDVMHQPPEIHESKKEHFRTRSMVFPNNLKSQCQLEPLGSQRKLSSEEYRSRLEYIRKTRNKKLTLEKLKEIHRMNNGLDANDNYYEEEPMTQRSPCNIASARGEDRSYIPVIKKNPPVAISRIDLSSCNFDLQTKINEAEAMSVIRLPEQTIQISELIIKKPITIIGSAGSTVEVSHSIHIDLSGYPKENQKVVFSECTLHFEYFNRRNLGSQTTSTKRSKESSEKRSYSETINNNNFTRFLGQMTTELHRTDSNSSMEFRIYPLFVIHQNSTLSIRDSRITSKNTDSLNPVFQDICFYLKQPQTCMFKKTDPHPTLIAQSTFISNFHTVMQNSMLGRIYSEKLYISNCRSHAVNISNPYILEMNECVIEHSAKSCVNIRFSKEIGSDTERRILIEKNEFSDGQSYGVSIFGENIIHQNCSIKLNGNKIRGFQKDGLGIKNLNIREIWVGNNEITHNRGNGICIHNVLDTKTFSQVQFFKNKILQSYLYGVTLIDVSFYSEEDEISQNSKGGVIISAGEKIQNAKEFAFYKNYPVRTIFNSTQLVQNKDSGLIVVGTTKGPVILKSCQIKENTNGLYIKQAPISLSETSSYSPRAESSQGLGDIVLEKCSVAYNMASGIYLRNMASKLYLKETSVHENKNYAIFIQNSENVNNLGFMEEGKEKVREYISGYIGGTWGMLYEQNYNICKTSRCSMF